MSVFEMTSPGSSPHTRGARVPVDDERPVPGIIPAYAGSTQSASSAPCRWDGSSPHTRGAPFRPVRGLFSPRIIPAYAGSTGTLRLSYIQFRDHPRIRGEHVASEQEI